MLTPIYAPPKIPKLRTIPEILALVDRLHQEGKTIITVTHDADVARRAGRIIRFKDGAILSDRDKRSLPS